MSKQGYIYIITNQKHTVLYTGVTFNLQKRIWEHKSKIVSSFSSKYNLDKLVYFEQFDLIEQAIAREKQIKAGSRDKKLELINSMNPKWEDMYHTIL